MTRQLAGSSQSEKRANFSQDIKIIIKASGQLQKYNGMVIGIDASRANKKQKTGTEWYSFFLIEELKKITAGTNHKIILYSREPLSGEFSDLPMNWESKVLRWPLKYLWTQARLSFEMLFNAPDVLFIPAHSIPLIYAKNTVVTWHDVGFERFKYLYSKAAYYYHKWVVRYSLKNAKKIIVISKFTKDEILDLFKNINESKLNVVYNGYDRKKYHCHLDKGKIKDVVEKYRIFDPYIIFIGRLEEKKNIIKIIEAFAEFKKKNNLKESLSVDECNDMSRHNKYKLVLVGRRGYGYEKIKKLIFKHKIENEVIELGWTESDDVPYLLAGADLFIFLSLYEGFGIPVLEAMACGVPVIASDIPCLREVAGDAALFADPYNTKAVAQSMEENFLDKELRYELIRKGFERVKKFSWEKCAKETLEVLINF